MNRRSFSKAVAGLFAAMGIGAGAKASTPVPPPVFPDGAEMQFMGYEFEPFELKNWYGDRLYKMTLKWMRRDGSRFENSYVSKDFDVDQDTLDHLIGKFL
jgi:hypothetical protein